MDWVWHLRACRVLCNALRMAINSCLADDSPARRVAASYLRMDAGGLRQPQRVRSVCAGADSWRALLRREAFAPADFAGAGPVSSGPFTCAKYRDICLAAAASGAHASVVAIRPASNPERENLFGCFSRHAGRDSWPLNVGLRD